MTSLFSSKTAPAYTRPYSVPRLAAFSALSFPIYACQLPLAVIKEDVPELVAARQAIGQFQSIRPPPTGPFL